MAYLILSDFKKLIQSDNLSAIIGNDYTILDHVAKGAIEKVKEHLIQKYDCSKEFTDTIPWVRATAYKGNNRVYLDATAYSAASVYVTNDLCLQAGNVYISIGGNAAHTFNATEWILIGVQYSMFYVTLPYLEFNSNSVYAKGNQVFWKDKVYTCVLPTIIPSHAGELQVGTYNNLPALNIFPDDSANGVKYWGTGVAYSVAAGTLPTDSTKFTEGDNRNENIVDGCIDIALYRVHKRIAPNNVPDLRVKAYDDCIKWLKDCAVGGFVTLNVPLIQPNQGMRIRWGGEVKRKNNY